LLKTGSVASVSVMHGPRPRLAVRSSLPGRVRWYSPALHHRPRMAGAVEDIVAVCGGVTLVEVNSLTGSVLVHFNTALLNLCTLERAVLNALEGAPITHAAWNRRVERQQHQALQRQSRDGQPPHAWHLGLDGVMLAGMVIRRVVPELFAAIFAPPWAILAGAALLLDGIALLRGVSYGFQQSPASSDARPTGWLSMFAEWNVALFAGVWLLNLALYLKWRSDRLTHKALPSAEATPPVLLGYSRTATANASSRRTRRLVLTEPTGPLTLPDIHIQLPATVVSFTESVQPA